MNIGWIKRVLSARLQSFALRVYDAAHLFALTTYTCANRHPQTIPFP